MKSVDLHPEELLERDARGELSSDEQLRLEEHLGQCDVCRFERLARQEIQQEVDQAETLDLQRLVTLAPQATTIVAPPRIRRRTAWRPSRSVLLVTALLTVASASAAGAGWSTLRTTFSHRDRAAEPVAPPASPSVPSAVAAVAVTIAQPGEIAAPPDPDPAPELRREATHGGPPPQPPSTATATASADSMPGAAEMFAQATRARRAGDHAGAVQGYQGLVAAYPASPEGRHALALLGRMRLDDGDAAGALRSFDAYLSAGGLLREDVMADRALALQRLGRPADETAAWSALLGAYPASVHADRARRRLAELEGR
jgi:TolA-binding protein